MTKRKREIDLKSLARGYTEVSIRTVAGLAKDASDEGVRLQANKLLMERGWGRPAQTHEHTGEGGGAIVVRVVYGEDDE